MGDLYPSFHKRRLAIQAVAQLFDRHNFQTFEAIERFTGLSKSEVVLLKPALQEFLGCDITSRVDLQPPGLFLED